MKDEKRAFIYEPDNLVILYIWEGEYQVDEEDVPFDTWGSAACGIVHSVAGVDDDDEIVPDMDGTVTGITILLPSDNIKAVVNRLEEVGFVTKVDKPTAEPFGRHYGDGNWDGAELLYSEKLDRWVLLVG